MNDFFRILYSNPSLLWKAGAALLFISLGLMIYFAPNYTGLSDGSRMAFAGLLLLYGLFRAATFFIEYKNVKEDR